jgi:DNA-binding beta-propeller fold protein YncE
MTWIIGIAPTAMRTGNSTTMGLWRPDLHPSTTFPFWLRIASTTDPAALVIGPTGLALSKGTLYVADTLRNRIASISDALTRTTDAGQGDTLSQGKALNQPLGLAIANNGHVLTVNGGDGNIVETNPGGNQMNIRFIDVSNQSAGTLFGLAVAQDGKIYFVDDGNNTLNVLRWGAGAFNW